MNITDNDINAYHNKIDPSDHVEKLVALLDTILPFNQETGEDMIVALRFRFVFLATATAAVGISLGLDAQAMLERFLHSVETLNTHPDLVVAQMLHREKKKETMQ